MSKLSDPMVGCLRMLRDSPQMKSHLEQTCTGWSVKALLKRGYISEYEGATSVGMVSMLMITITGLAALQLEDAA